MTDAALALDVDAFAAALAGTFPAPRDAGLAVTLLRLLANGAPVSTEELAEASGGCADDVAQRLAALPSVEFDEAGRVVAFIGLSLRPTAHRVALGEETLFTWCAWDTLFLPALLDRTACVQSTCPVTGQPISLTVTPQNVVDLDPVEAVMSIVVPTGSDPIRSTFCCNVMFLASPDAGRTWLADRTDGALRSVDQAYELGRRLNERFFQHTRPEHGGSR